MKLKVILFCFLATCMFGQGNERNEFKYGQRIFLSGNNITFKPCVTGLSSSYANTHCSQLGVNYSFPVLDDFFHSSGSVNVKASDITFRPDPNGPYTILISSPKFNVKAGQSVNVVFSFNVEGATQVNAWTHGCSTTHDGTVADSQIVDAVPTLRVTSGCSSSNNNPEPQAGGKYKSVGYMSTQVVIHLEGGKKGTASIRSLGTHYHP